MTRPEKVSGLGPEYTPEARRARIQGVVIIEVLIDEAGNVTNAKVLKPLPLGLDYQAVEAVKRWKFRPATLHGRPVAVYYNLTVNFRVQRVFFRAALAQALSSPLVGGAPSEVPLLKLTSVPARRVIAGLFRGSVGRLRVGLLPGGTQ